MAYGAHKKCVITFLIVFTDVLVDVLPIIGSYEITIEHHPILTVFCLLHDQLAKG